MKHIGYSILILIGCLSTSASNAYDPAAVAVHPTLLNKYEQFFPAEVLRVTDGVYVARGFNRDNPTLIIGPSGLIVVDPGESIDGAQQAKDAFNAHLDNIFDKRPVKAIIYTHHHDCHINGASVFADERTEIIAHENLMRSLFSEWYGQVFPSRVEGGLKMSGILFQDAPVEQGEGWYAGYVLAGKNFIGPSGFLPPTIRVKDRLDTMIAGVRLTLISAPGETDDVILVWLPQKQVLIQIGILYEAFPALTTMRGSRQRDPLDYVESLKICRSLEPEYLVALHGPNPITSGKENVRQYLTNFSDAIQFMHDQTIQYLNQGFTPGEIKDLLELPPHLAQSPYLQETYGRKDWNIYHIFRFYRGYYTGAVRDLFPQSPLSEARLSAELAGGVDALAGKAQSALAAGELEWALRLADDVLLLDEWNDAAFETKKAAMLALAADDMNAQARNMLLSDYLLMTQPDSIIAPFPFGDPKAIFARINDQAMRLMPMETLNRIMAVNLNAAKSIDEDRVMGLRLTDRFKHQSMSREPNQYRFQVRHGILEVDPPSDGVGQLLVTTDSLTWKALVLGKLAADIAVADHLVSISGGSAEDFYAFMDLFESS
ncbi:MAG: MBL fold metallo-hydrolase [Gammaproteobacteria bacterium]|nr:MBL fold metallo-hydrolase [Gammaproteobacteria bacterium]